MQYLASHWRGEQSLARSFWLNLVVGYLLVVGVLVGIGQAVHARWFLYLGMTIFVAQTLWAMVGLFRCALKIVRSSASIRSKFFAYVALALVVIAVLVGARDIVVLAR
jgi:hypothetical protein